MLILSTFNSDYLQSPLHSLLKLFKPQPVNIKYVNKNLIGELLNLKSNLEEKSSYVILLRIDDFIENANIDEIKLEKHLNLIVKQITFIKQEKELTILVFLCPCSSSVYCKNPILEEIEKNFINKLNENKIHTLTLLNIKERYGDVKFENPIEADTHIPYTPKFYIAIAGLLARKLHAIIQKSFKVIAVDCDNTLWDGVAADLGIEGVLFKEHNIFLQKYLVDQQKKGKIICLCSKNEEQTVLDVFNKRQSEMILRLEHISKYEINWREKKENIGKLALDLNVYPDSFRFIDDNPIEIENVKQIPGVVCITMPQNIQECKDELLFESDEHAVITEEDKSRPEALKQAEIKTALATQFRDPIDYLRSPELGQSIVISKIDLKEIKAIERVCQLSGKTNRFNTYPEKGKEICEINKMIASDKKEVFIGRIKDNFSSEEIAAISMCSIEKNNIIIDNFFVSCRSFNRSIEFEMLKHIALIAQEKTIRNIKIKFKKSDKNVAAGCFFNILSQINKDSSSKSFFNESRNHPWLYACFKFLIRKKNRHLDVNSFELNKEAILTLSVQKLIEIELDFLIRLSLKTSQKSTQTQQNIEVIFDSNQKINEENLIELKKMTSSLDYAENQFFIDDKIFKPSSKLTIVHSICNNFLGEEGQDEPLVNRGLDSITATLLSYYLYENIGIEVTNSKLLHPEMKVSELSKYPIKQKKIIEPTLENSNFYNQKLPVSFQQQRIWLAEQNESTRNSANFHMTACYKMNKNLDIERFRLACHKLITLYDVFGASFFMEDGTLKQLILAPKDRKLNFQEIELIEVSLEEAISYELTKFWTMASKAPLMKVTLFKDSNYYIFFHVHHAIFDAISLKNCLDTLSELYEKNELDFKLVAPQYNEFIDYQKQKLQNLIYIEKGLDYIRGEFSNIKEVSTSPSDQSLLHLNDEAIRYSFSLSANQAIKLKNIAKTFGTTFYSLLCSLYILLIASYTYQENITLVTVTNGRDGHPLFNKMVGFFINLLVHQFSLKKDQFFIDIVKQINKKLLDGQEFQDIPFNKIQEVLADLGIKNILLSPAFIFQNFPISEFKLGELTKPPIILDDRKIVLFGGLTLYAQHDINGKLNFVFECKKSEYSQFRLSNLEYHFKILIKACCENPNQKLQDIPLISENECNELIRIGQGPKINYVENDSLIKRFQCSAKNYPDQIALCYDQVRMSYKDLDQQSTNLGYALIEAGVEKDNYVGIFLEANHQFFIAELAILKIGAIFIPLSTADPLERLKSIIDDAKINFFIVDTFTREVLDRNLKTCQLILVNSIKDKGLINNLPLLTQTMENRVCILYTSGSTGRPKGVILLQKGIFRIVESPNFIEVFSGDKIAQTANQAFDAAQFECWLAWNNGACLVILNKKTILDVNLLQNKLVAEEITHMWLTAGLFNIHANDQPDMFNSLKYLIVGGDVVDKNVVLKVLDYENSPKIINGYGPTETSIFALTYMFNRKDLDRFISSPIGIPVNNTKIQIVTPWGSPAPIGAIGEILIEGDGVSEGYFSSSKEGFFLDHLKVKKYHSGDLGQYHHSTLKLLFIGRANEEQYKINGHRISPTEIENHLVKHSAIKTAAVVNNKLAGINQIIIFFTLNEGFSRPTDKELRVFSKTGLTDYMIPNHFVSVNNFLLNANGKLDKKQFEKYLINKGDSDNVKKGVGDEQTLLNILKNELIGFPDDIDANFFEWGLNSLQAVSLMSKLNDKFFHTKDQKLTVADLQMNPTVESLTSLIKKPCIEKEKTILHLLKKGDPNLPVIIFIHPAGGGISCFSQLIGHLKINNACYGIEDPLLHNNQLKLLSLEHMGKDYYHEIINKFKTPIILVGFSFGGLLAWEIAKSFETKAENNNLVRLILLDTWVVSCANKENKDRLMKDVIEYCATQRKKVNLEGDLSDMVILLEKLCEHHQNIGFTFTPKTLLATKVYLYKAKALDAKFSEMNAQDKNNFLLRFIEPKLFEKCEIDASHYDLLENSDKNYLALNFSNLVEEINQEILSKKNTNLPCNSNFFHQPLAEINNPQFTCPETKTMNLRM